MEQDSKLLHEEDEEDKLVARAFGTVDGLRLLEVLESKFYNRPDYNPVELQPFHTFFRSGQRDVVGWIKEAIKRSEEDVGETKVKTTL